MAVTAPVGIIDTLSEGFAIVNRRLWILLLPLLLDLLLAFGPGISAAPVVENVIAMLDQAMAGQQAGGDGGASTAPQDWDDALAGPREALERFRDANVLGVLAWKLPSLITATSSTPLPLLHNGALLQADNGWTLAGYVVALAVLGLFSASFYLAALAQPLREDQPSTGTLLRRTLDGWLNLLLLYTALAFLSLPVGGALLLFLGVLGLLGGGAVSFASGAALALLMTLAFYMFFVDDAIFVAGAPPWRAAWYSIRVVWRHFWSAAAFILLANLILIGTPIAWRVVLEQGIPAATVGALAGHAYIGSGLAAAGMVFLKQRLLTMRGPAAPIRGSSMRSE